MTMLTSTYAGGMQFSWCQPLNHQILRLHVLNFVTPPSLSRESIGRAGPIKMNNLFKTVARPKESRYPHDTLWIPPSF